VQGRVVLFKESISRQAQNILISSGWFRL